MRQTRVSDEHASLGEMKNLISTYEEIAAGNMRRVRSAVVAKRDFLTEITLVYNEVIDSYKKELDRLRKKKKLSSANELSLIPRNGRNAAILLSANTGLYGDIIHQTVGAFVEQLKTGKVDAIVIGIVGKRLVEEALPGLKFRYFDLPDSSATPEAIRSIVLAVVPYEKAVVYHGKFESIITQRPEAFSLAYTPPEPQDEKQARRERYFFEPGLSEIAIYFEKEIFATIFEQTVHESELAKYASRMVTLDRATENIKTRLKRLEVLGRVLTHEMDNKKQQDMLSGMHLWKVRL